MPDITSAICNLQLEAMIIARSFWRQRHRHGPRRRRLRVAVRSHDPRLEVCRAPGGAARNDRPASPGARLAFSATAYCKGIVTASGVPVQSGVAAADPELLPVGSVIEVDSLPQLYNGIYTRSWTPGPPCRAVRSTSTCGAATRRCSSAAGRFTSRCCASAGTRARRRRASSIASSTAPDPPAAAALAAAFDVRPGFRPRRYRRPCAGS